MPAWHGLGSVSFPFSANIAAFPCLLLPLQTQGTLQAAPPASGPPSSAESSQEHSLLILSSYSLRRSSVAPCLKRSGAANTDCS